LNAITVENFNELCNYIKSTSVDKLVYNCFQCYWNRMESSEEISSTEQLIQFFEQRPFKEVLASSSYFIESIKDISENIVRYEWLYNRLSSSRSKDILFLLLRAKLFLDFDCLLRANDEDRSQYFIDRFFNYKTDEVFADCGTYRGETSLEFIEKCPDYKKIYAFEPNSRLCAEICRNLELFSFDGSIDIHCAGVGNQNSYCFFEKNSESGDGFITDIPTAETARILKLDDIAPDATFIKLDVEGFELQALLGAEKLIRSTMPKIAVCLYHKPGDFWRIPSLIDSFNNGYRFEIIHFQPFEYTDTILLCIPNHANDVSREHFPNPKALERLWLLNKLNSQTDIQDCHIEKEQTKFNLWLKLRLNKELKQSSELKNNLYNLIEKNAEIQQYLEQLQQENSFLMSKNEEISQYADHLKHENGVLMHKNEEMSQYTDHLKHENGVLMHKNEEMSQYTDHLKHENGVLMHKNEEMSQYTDHLKSELEIMLNKHEELYRWSKKLESKLDGY